MMTVPPQLTSSLPSFSYPASFRHPPPASSIIYIERTCLVAPMLLLIRMRSVCIQLNTKVIKGLVKRAQLLWHVHNFCETCTSAGKRAQHNISETCTYRILEKTGWGRWNTLYIYIYIIYICVIIYVYVLCVVCVLCVTCCVLRCVYVHMHIYGWSRLGLNAMEKVGQVWIKLWPLHIEGINGWEGIRPSILWGFGRIYSVKLLTLWLGCLDFSPKLRDAYLCQENNWVNI